MGRYVVVEFADNDEAEAFVQHINEGCKNRRKLGEPFTRRIVGVFVKPGRTCSCSDWARANSGDKNWRPADISLGAKFGWWICSRCKKPRRGGHQLNNQLDMSDTYEGVIYNDYEFCVTSIDVTGIHKDQVSRSKKLRRKKVK